MKDVRKVLSLCIAFVMLIALLAGCGGSATNNSTSSVSSSNATTAVETQGTTASAQKVELEVISADPEFEAQEREIWSLYEEKNPNVTIKLISVNEDQGAALDARIAAGNAPAIQDKRTGINKDNYKTFTNLLNINFPYWDKYSYDYKTALVEDLAIPENYVPNLNPFTGRYFSFAYYQDMMEKAGLDPRNSVRTIADLDNLFAQLKDYIDKTKAAKYVWDLGWNTDMEGQWLPPAVAVAMGFDYQQLMDTYAGKIKWTDENGPYAAYFKKLKEWYDKGYLPDKFWTRNWEKETEAGFVARDAMLIFHGIWIYSKVEAADPNAKLSAFPLPGGKDGNVWAGVASKSQGSVIFAANEGKPEFPEIVKAFVWYCSPEIVKLRCEDMGNYPAWDLSDVGGVDLKDTQYTQLVKPLNDGVFGKVKWQPSAAWPTTPMSKYYVTGKPEILQDDAMASEFGKYLQGKYQLKDMLELCQKRWEDGYKIN